ncbi:tail fiber domain-containing protein [Burkholderia multivorans]|uniref:tail fiber domain-containing protein n=1 Tax=Burkholderia multivorans TaxID=87883 RepID=UPI0009E0D2DE|nr:tail fiber domain-containing protein [Burkholderia multivorans]SAJ89341.1 hypothetical protein UA11_04086 [Burkholderia multivorans]
MPRNGSGTYQLPAGNPVVTGTTISSSGWANPTLADIASALTASIAVDGQTIPTANLPMGNFRHLNVSNGQNTNEYATVGQIQAAGFQLLGGTAGTINTTQSATIGGLTITPPTGSQGQIKLSQAVAGPSSTFLRARQNGGWEFINTAYTAAIVWSDDVGNLTAHDFTASSDERLKEDWRPVDRDFLVRMANVLRGTFSWKADGTRSAGVGAASLRDVFPEVVHEDARGMLSVSYGHAALVTVLELIPVVLRLLDKHGDTP